MNLEITGERVAIGHSDTRNEQDHVDRYVFAKQFVTDKSVLDIACGTGFGSKILADAHASSVYGVDISPESITYAKEHYNHPSITYVCASAGSLDMPSAQFDAVVSYETIEHLEADVRKNYLQEMHRVLKDDGILIISTPNKRITSPWKQKPNNPFHVLEFTKAKLTDELKASGFTVTEFFGQRLVLTFLTWRFFRMGIRLFEKIFHRQFHIYDVASGRGVNKVPFGYQQRYFVVLCRKVIK